MKRGVTVKVQGMGAPFVISYTTAAVFSSHAMAHCRVTRISCISYTQQGAYSMEKAERQESPSSVGVLSAYSCEERQKESSPAVRISCI